MKTITGNDWDALLADEWQKPYYRELRDFLINEYKTETVYPPAGDIYNALRMTDYDDVKVVILGQDPYHEPGQAHGLAFSVPRGTPLPPSLVNILKELEADLGIRYAPEDAGENVNAGAGSQKPHQDYNDGNGDDAEGILVPWTRQGVLLLNTVLTVRAHQAASHRGRGWEQFTDRVIELLAEREKPMVFVLWGAHAQAKKELILKAQRTVRSDQSAQRANCEELKAQRTVSSESVIEQTDGSEPSRSIGNAAPSQSGSRHLIIEAPHPSPLSAYRGFFGGCYFSRCNYFLVDNGIEPVDWSL